MWNLKHNMNKSLFKVSHEHDYQRGEGGGEGQIKSRGLTDANYHT